MSNVDPNPQWFQRVNERLDEREPKASMRKSAIITYPLAQHSRIMDAVNSRNMRLATYARRALLAFVAYDLGIDLEDLLKDEPSYSKHTGGVGHRKDDKPPSGDWEIAALIGRRDG